MPHTILQYMQSGLTSARKILRILRAICTIFWIIRQGSNKLDGSFRDELSSFVILSEAKDLTRWTEILRFTQDDTVVV